MTMSEYQKAAMKTCMPSSENFSYMMLNLVGEVGEFASKVAKAIRKDQEMIDGNNLLVCGKSGTAEELKKVTPEEIKQILLDEQEREKELQKEAGDILWQLSGLCSVMGWRLEDIAQQNLDKLASRQTRGVISGDGDNR